jgi:hypothetical protein
MNQAGLNHSTPQFGTVEYVGSPGGDRCRFCQQPIAANYYRLNGAMACSNCAQRVQSQIPKDSQADYVRGLLFGIGAAVAGLVLYATFEITTGIIIGYLSLAVGWMVGKAMMKGSNGRGGRRYQIAAVLLTYASVSLAAIPVWIHYAGEHRHERHASQQQQRSDGNSAAESESGPQSESAPARPPMNQSKALLQLAFLGLASPFLELADPVHGAIGLFILFIGIRIAWQTTRAALPILDGPFPLSSPPPAKVNVG